MTLHKRVRFYFTEDEAQQIEHAVDGTILSKVREALNNTAEHAEDLVDTKQKLADHVHQDAPIRDLDTAVRAWMATL